jgi:HK97 family phage major capsid protein
MSAVIDRAVDNSPWDGNAAMTSAKTAADYRAICAGKRDGDPEQRSTWALPHHKTPDSPPNAAGVRAALARVGQTEGIDQAAARRHLEAHMREINPERALPDEDAPKNIVRALPALDVEESRGDGTIATMRGDLAVFGEWAPIKSLFEGEFVERVMQGTFADAFANGRDRMRVLLEHGTHPVAGRLPLGPIYGLQETERSAQYEVGLLDTEFNRDLLKGLQAGLYGSSFRGDVDDDEWERWPKPSSHNPEGIPERSLKRIKPLLDFGPTPFPAYLGATATARSLTDEYIFRQLESGEGLKRFHEWAQRQKDGPIEVRSDPPPPAPPLPPTPAPSPAPAPPTQPTPGAKPPEDQRPVTRKETAVAVDLSQLDSREKLVEARDQAQARIESLGQEHAARAMPSEVEGEFNGLVEKRDAVVALLESLDKRDAAITRHANGNGRESGTEDRTAYQVPSFQTKQSRIPENVYDLSAYRTASRSLEDLASLYVDGAKKAIEIEHYPNPVLSREEAQRNISDLMDRVQGDERQSGKEALARHILATGSQVYRQAAGKFMRDQSTAMLTPEENHALIAARALSLTGSAGGFAVPFELDPTVLGTSNGTINPIRQLARVENITVDEWRGITSAGITAGYSAEATETTDNAPTLVQPTVSTEKAQAFVPFSIEVGMDWDGLQTEMARALGEAKDELEAAKFVAGTGTNEPFGVLTGTTNTVAGAAGNTFTLANLYSLLGALPPRYRSRGAFLGNLLVLNRIRQFDTAGGAALWVTLGADVPDRLLGRPVLEASDMADVANAVKFLLFGDFSRYLIADRIGLSIDLIPHLVGANHRPTGQRGIYAFWRNGAKVLDANAFRALLGTA